MSDDFPEHPDVRIARLANENIARIAAAQEVMWERGAQEEERETLRAAVAELAELTWVLALHLRGVMKDLSAARREGRTVDMDELTLLEADLRLLKERLR